LAFPGIHDISLIDSVLHSCKHPWCGWPVPEPISFVICTQFKQAVYTGVVNLLNRRSPFVHTAASP